MMKIVNQTVPLALRTLRYGEAEVVSIVDYINKEDTIEGAADLKPEHLPVFDCAFQPQHGTRFIPWRAHVLMMAAAQPFIAGAISKTVNMPKDSTPEDIAGAYLQGWKLGLKALAVYRDGSKESQPLSTTNGEKAEKVVSVPRRERLPDTRNSITHKFSVGGHEGYITVGLYPDGRPGELFITMAKEGSTIGGLMDCFGTAVSMSLQYGVPLDVYVNKFSHTRFEPMGFTKSADIRIAKSVVDYIFRWLGITFLPGYRDANKLLQPGAEEPAKGGPGDVETEPSPAARKAGGPIAGPGSAAFPGSTAAKGKAPGSGVKPAGGAGNGHGNGATSKASSAPTASGSTDRPSTCAPAEVEAALGNLSEQFAAFQADVPICEKCGSITVRNGNCYLCYVCGSSLGCS
jgi:ribonucleoside-diphosphate reductase alpha chain